MITQEKVSRFINPLRKKSVPAEVGVYSLHQAAMRLSDLHSGRARFKAKDLVGFLMCHGARVVRSGMPRASIRISVVTPTRHTAVKIRLQ